MMTADQKEEVLLRFILAHTCRVDELKTLLLDRSRDGRDRVILFLDLADEEVRANADVLVPELSGMILPSGTVGSGLTLREHVQVELDAKYPRAAATLRDMKAIPIVVFTHGLVGVFSKD